MDHDEIVRLYGPWAARRPEDAAALLDGYSGAWWIAGGWAIEAFGGVAREHDDLDLGIPSTDVGAFVSFLAGRYDVWHADDGALRPLGTGEVTLPTGAADLWLRAGGSAPWEFDVKVTPVESGEWVYRGDARITRPLPDVLWRRDGIPYLAPEVQLLHKASGRREKDEADARACLPLLGAERAQRLVEALRIVHPGHPWLDVL